MARMMIVLKRLTRLQFSSARLRSLASKLLSMSWKDRLFSSSKVLVLWNKKYLVLTCFWQVPFHYYQNILNILDFHLVKFFRSQSLQVRKGVCLGWIVGILLQQFEEDCFAVEVTDCVIKAEFDLSAFMTLLVSVHIVRLFVIWNTRTLQHWRAKAYLKLPTNRILPFSESSKLISRSPWPPSMTKNKLRSMLALI